MEWDVEKVASIIGVRENEILQALEAAEEPIVFGKPEPIVLTETQMKAINQLKIPGVFAVKKQYDRKIPPAAQLIGLVGQNEKQISLRYPEKNIPKNTNIGISGLQKSFDEFLLQEENTKLIYHVDGHGGLSSVLMSNIRTLQTRFIRLMFKQPLTAKFKKGRRNSRTT